jgi:Tol biopolymer transport system component
MLAVLLLSGCLGDFFNPLDQPGLRVVVLPADTAVYAGAQYRARGRMLNQYGDLYPSEHIDFGGADAAASVSGAGVVSGETIGRARVIARRGDLADTSWVSVVPQGTLAFSLLADPSFVDLINLDGSGFQRILTAGQFRGGAPAWLPQGDGFVYQEATPGGAGSSVLYFADLAGNRRILLPVHGDFADEKYARVSRDGWVYFRWQEGEIWRVRVDGSSLERAGVTDTLTGDTHPDPSPDGTRLVLASSRFPEGIRLVIRDLASGAEQSLGVQGLLPRWSPSGDRIAYWSGDVFSQRGAIYLIQPDGSGNQRLSPLGKEYRPEGLDWSPDGEWLVARADTTLELIQTSTGTALPLAYSRDHNWAAFRPQVP